MLAWFDKEDVGSQGGALADADRALVEASDVLLC